MSNITSKTSRRKQTPASTFRGVLPAVDKLLKVLDHRTQEYAVMRFLRDNAVGPQNAKCWKEIQPYLRRQGHSGYKKRAFQTSWLQICRRNGCFIASYNKGYYLPGKQEDFLSYENATARRIKGEQANLQAARALCRLQQEHDAARKSKRTRTRTTARRTGTDRPTAFKTAPKDRSKGRRSTRS